MVLKNDGLRVSEGTTTEFTCVRQVVDFLAERFGCNSGSLFRRLALCAPEGAIAKDLAFSGFRQVQRSVVHINPEIVFQNVDMVQMEEKGRTKRGNLTGVEFRLFFWEKDRKGAAFVVWVQRGGMGVEILRIAFPVQEERTDEGGGPIQLFVLLMMIFAEDWLVK